MSDSATIKIQDSVRDHYGQLAEASETTITADCCSTPVETTCCDTVTLYDVDTAWLPSEVTGFSLGCGDPITLANLKPGQTVLDLGSGGGLDCFLAAGQVGPQGYVIGLDMTPQMIAKAQQNKEKLGLKNVDFRLGQIEAMPVDSATVDVIISNCVINLSPDKQAVFGEAFRVLKPGGRLAISDIVTHGRFDAQERANMQAWASCITGAEEVSDYLDMLRKAGFHNISIRDKEDPTAELAERTTSWSGAARPFSARVTAEKPAMAVSE